MNFGGFGHYNTEIKQEDAKLTIIFNASDLQRRIITCEYVPVGD